MNDVPLPLPGEPIFDSSKASPILPLNRLYCCEVEEQLAIPSDSDSEQELRSTSSPTLRLQTCLKQGVSLEVVQDLLDQQADPNAPMEYRKTKDITGTAFTLAVSMCRKDIVLALAYGSADVNSTYSFIAGAEKVRWSGPAICASISRKSVAMMRLLVDLHANINGRLLKFGTLQKDGTWRDKPNGTLLYEAAYVGCAPIVRYLLKRTSRKGLEVKVSFQDDLKQLYTPLAIAVHRGHSDVVKLLLENHAAIGANDQSGRGPPMLVDAILMCHVDVVKELVTASADIFSGASGAADCVGPQCWSIGSYSIGPENDRGIDYILQAPSSNSVIMAAVAQGLKHSNHEASLRKLRIDDIVRFLWTSSGDEILDAIFRPRVLQTWVAQPDGTLGTRPVRKEWRTALVGPDSKIQINVAAGPDIEEFTKRFFHTMQNVGAAADRDEGVDKSISKVLRETNVTEEEFMENLTHCYYATTKQGRASGSRRACGTHRQVPAEYCQCVVPHLHTNSEVMLAITKGSNHALFDHAGAQAIVMYGWRQCASQYKWTFFLNFALAIFFFAMSIILQQEQTTTTKSLKWVFIIIIILVWSRNIYYEVMQMIGLVILGHGREYFLSFENYLDFARILFTLASIIIMLNSDHWDVNNSVALKTVLAYTMWARWIRVLYSARGFESSGQHMLAIIYAVGSVWPFLSVVMWPLLGFINGYYMMGVYDLWRSAIIVYRMSFVGDFDLEEVEDIDPTAVAEGDPLTDGYYQEMDPELTEKNKLVGVLMVIITMFFTIALMNILIGVLSEAYARYFERRDRLFLQTRAAIVLEYRAVDEATKGLLQCIGCRKRRIRSFASDTDLCEPEYLWFCRQKKADELGLDDEDDDDFDAVGSNDRIEGIRADVEKLKEQLSAFAIKTDAVTTKHGVLLEEIAQKLEVGTPSHRRNSQTSMGDDMDFRHSLSSGGTSRKSIR